MKIRTYSVHSYYYLLIVGWVSCQVGEVNKLHVEGPKLSQDATACWRPTPVTADPTEENKNKQEQRNDTCMVAKG